jgi:hypothetical protein
MTSMLASHKPTKSAAADAKGINLRRAAAVERTPITQSRRSQSVAAIQAALPVQ